jgi:cell division protein FtsI/penicillin-binding protein 2
VEEEDVARRRILPLILALLAGTALLVARLYQVQVVEAGIWSAQAATLVRSGTVRPYARGAILDAQGRALARDERTYRLLFNYRDFRRGHPLGLVAHARTALLGEPVALADALANLPQWTAELAALDGAALESFARGDSMTLGARTIAATGTPEREARRLRRSDLRFYMAQLFDLDRSQARTFTRALTERPNVSMVELAAELRGMQGASELLARLAQAQLECSEDLTRLALQLDADALALGEVIPPGHPVERLIERLEDWRAHVEDDTASDLFEESFEFRPGRIEAATLHGAVDLRWIEALLGWDEERSLQWILRARETEREALLTQAPERLIAELQVGAGERDAAELVLERVALAFSADPERTLLEGWRACADVCVLDRLDELFDVELARAREALFPWQDAERLGAAEPQTASWETLAKVELGVDADPSEVAQLASAWSAALGERVDAPFVRERVRALFSRWDHDLQLALEGELGARVALARAAGHAKLAAAEGRLDRAAERARYVLKDRGSRPLPVVRQPSYATVHLVSRHGDRYAGLSVVESTERVSLLDPRGQPLARALVGSVGGRELREDLAEGELRRHFMELRARSERSEEESRELRYLARRIVRGDEQRGRTGLEAYFDQELAGKNGYREVRGLQNRLEGVYQLDLPPEDGLDLELSLDIDLQRAALECLARPEGPPDPSARDAAWLASPTGAIVLLDVRGDVLVAASYPDYCRDPSETPSHKDLPLERTWRKAPFQPPGSSFKPFVAAWGLAYKGLDPLVACACAPLPSGRGAGYVDVRCASSLGHGNVGLRSAIAQSCNSYFARLGERFDAADWRALAEEFGFGQPTGVRSLGRRSGWVEHTVPHLFRGDIGARESRLAGNGLSVVEATPMQVARAVAGLATGRLPELRIARRIGGVEQEQRSRPLALPESALEFVRDSMDAVANEPHGSAYAALHAGELGLRMAAKTGSGDIDSRKVLAADGRERVRKHTWLVGWLPSRAPRHVVVVYCEDTLQTASNSAIWLARQFLRRPEVHAVLVGEGAR